MPEVINLLSSSPELPTHPKLNYQARSKIVRQSDLDKEKLPSLSDDWDLPSLQPIKRRKLSPGLPHIGNSRIGRFEDNIPRSEDGEDVSVVRKTVAASWNARWGEKGKDLPSSDPITFTSSAPEPRNAKKQPTQEIFDLSDDSDLPDSVLDVIFKKPTTIPDGLLSTKTVDLLANLNAKTSTRPNKTKPPEKLSRSISNPVQSGFANTKRFADVISTLSSEDETPSNSRKASNLTTAEKEAKLAERAVANAAKDAEKEAERERKRLTKELKAREKQRAADIAEVNKSKLDKKESVQEMIIDMPRSFHGTVIGNRVEQFMKNLGVEMTYFEEEFDLSKGQMESQSPGRVVHWRRKISAKYDEELDCFTPLPRTLVKEENHILVHLTAAEFGCLAAEQDGEVRHIPETIMKANLDAHVKYLQRKYKDCIPIYMIEGLAAFLRKGKNAKNREYIAAARNADAYALDDPSAGPSATVQPTRTKRKSSKNAPADLSFITQALVDSLLLHLQLTHPTVLIHETSTAEASAQQILTFTTHISTAPYRRQRTAFNTQHAGFCMDSGQVRTADTAPEVYLRMLQELPRVTASMAYGIAGEGYSSVQLLVHGFRRHGREMLEDVRKSNNKDGGVSERRLGPAVSKRLHRVFFGLDPNTLDI